MLNNITLKNLKIGAKFNLRAMSDELKMFDNAFRETWPMVILGYVGLTESTST